jgi:hypothetical protein
VPDVHLLGDVRRRVVDDDAAALLGDVDPEPLAGQAQPELAPHGAVRGGDVEEAGPGDLDVRDRSVGAVQRLRQLAGQLGGARLHALRGGERDVGLEVGAVRAAHERVRARELGSDAAECRRDGLLDLPYQ